MKELQLLPNLKYGTSSDLLSESLHSISQYLLYKTKAMSAVN